MSDRPARTRRAVPALLSLFLPPLILLAAPAAAEPAVRLLDLPFKVTALRGPASEAAVAVATSGLLPIVRARPERGRPAEAGPGDEESAPIAVVWGADGGAVLAIEGGSVAARPIGREAVEGLTAAETPRGALAGSRRALAGPVTAYLTGRARAPDGGPAAAVLTVRERQPVAVSAEPRPVPVTTATVAAGPGAVFALQRPRVVRLSGRAAFLAATLTGADAGGLVLVSRPAGSGAADSGVIDPGAAWGVAARTPPQPHPPLTIVAVGDLSGAGTPQAATVDAAGLLRLWTLASGAIEPAGEAAGFAPGAGDADLGALVLSGGTPEIALPAAGGAALAVVALRGGLRERLRVPLPGPAATGIATLGEGAAARLVVGLADGRVAVVALDGGRP